MVSTTKQDTLDADLVEKSFFSNTLSGVAFIPLMPLVWLYRSSVSYQLSDRSPTRLERFVAKLVQCFVECSSSNAAHCGEFCERIVSHARIIDQSMYYVRHLIENKAEHYINPPSDEGEPCRLPGFD
jgi:hypothetical protein